MFNLAQYVLQPAELEQEFLTSRLAADKRKLARVFWLAIFIVGTFAVLGLIFVPPSEGKTIMNFARLVGVALSVFSLFSFRWIKSKRQLDWVAFGCLGWLIAQVELGHFLMIGTFEAMVAWDVFVIFLLFLAVPISLRFQVTLALIMSVVSVSIWISSKGDSYFKFEYVGVSCAYLATNIFGFICSVHAERMAREEFELLANEKRLKGNLETAFARLESTVESRNQIFRILAHDLRGSIGGLETIGRLISDEEQSEGERQELIDMLCDSSKSSYDLLENLLQWALSENGGLESESEEVPLSAAVSRNMDLLAVVARNKSIELSSAIGQDINVLVDPKMLETIVRNLISNAIKFTRAGGSVRVSARQREDGFVEVSVTDSGVGIDEERLSRLFHLPRSDSSLGTEGERGTNLGLRICSEFVAKHGGAIQATSIVGVGSCFTFTLPLSGKQAGVPAAML